MTIKITLMPPLTPAGLVLEAEVDQAMDIPERVRRLREVASAVVAAGGGDCEPCNGQGVVTDKIGDVVKCLQCDGSGRYPHFEECPKCRGTGETRELGTGLNKCTDCDGTGRAIAIAHPMMGGDIGGAS